MKYLIRALIFTVMVVLFLLNFKGHSQGSIGMLVNISLENRIFFVGDLVWSNKAFVTPSEKFYISSLLVDGDRRMLREQVYKVGLLLKSKPHIKAVPAHDIAAYISLIELGGKQ